MRNRVIVVVGLALVTVACSNDASVETTAPVASTTSIVVATTNDASAETTAPVASTTSVVAGTTQPVVSGVTMVEDLVYLSTEPHPWSLDVYFSPALESGPVVVFFHGGGMNKSNPLYVSIAEAIAAEGGVVFFPVWNDSRSEGVAGFLAASDAGGCAVSYALAHAPEYGADPERLVVAGHSGGAATAQGAGGLREVSPVAGCAVEQRDIEPDGLVLWDGDWLVGDPGWDRYDTDLPGLIDSHSPWSRLDDIPKVPVVLATASGSPNQLKRCGVDDSESLFWLRDPDGWFREQFNQLGMLDDGCIDNGEGEELLAQTMREYGFDATRIILEDSFHLFLSEQGQLQLVNAILTINDR